ncbi:MAG: DUF488 family protein [Sulfolobales archaeon]
MYHRKILTIGHSNRSLDDLIAILREFGVEILIDVRRWPKSRKHPHFSRENLEKILPSRGISYIWEEALGGYRRFGRDIEDHGIGKCFESEGFRAYANYILKNREAGEALERILRLAGEKLVAIMCAEKLPWNCHRKIISDWLVSKGYSVIHILDRDHVIEHRLTSCAEVINGTLNYK